jgi:hypothetical protein
MSGVFAYKLATGGMHFEIQTVRCLSNRVEMLFSKAYTGEYVQSPLSFSDAVIVATGSGAVQKLALDGSEVFRASVLRTNEICSLSARWDSKTVYLVAVHYEGPIEDRKTKYRLVWIDVHGERPSQKAELAVSEVQKAFRIENDIVICGPDSTFRVKCPDIVAR